MIKAPYIETMRLKLTEITEEDTGLVVKWRSNPDVYKYFLSSHALTASEHINWFKNQYLYDKNRFDYMARVKENNIAVGVFGIKRYEELPYSVEISYILDALYSGKGYASEAVSEIMDFAKREWYCQTAVAEIHKDNKESLHFIKNLGFSAILKKENFIIYSRSL